MDGNRKMDSRLISIKRITAVFLKGIQLTGMRTYLVFDIFIFMIIERLIKCMHQLI